MQNTWRRKSLQVSGSRAVIRVTGIHRGQALGRSGQPQTFESKRPPNRFVIRGIRTFHPSNAKDTRVMKRKVIKIFPYPCTRYFIGGVLNRLFKEIQSIT
jgi:hypothetical protein